MSTRNNIGDYFFIIGLILFSISLFLNISMNPFFIYPGIVGFIMWIIAFCFYS